MRDWIIKHQAVCDKDEDTCSECFIISESLWALSQAQEEMDQKKNKPKPQVKIKTKLAYNYKLQEWRDEVIK